jgi:hypothetical protein
LELTKALSIASKYTDAAHNLVRLTAGQIAAANAYRGVAITCSEVDVHCAVDCAALTRMVRALTDTPRLSLEKGRKLVVTDGIATFTLQAVPEARAPISLDPPSGCTWVEVSAEVVGCLGRLAGLVDLAIYNEQLAGVRLTGSWAAAGSGGRLAVCWIRGLVSAPFTVPPEAFAHLTGSAGMVVDGPRMWIRNGDLTCWTQGLILPWPDSIVDELICGERQDPGRITCQIEIAMLLPLLKQANAIAETKLDRYTLKLNDQQISISGGTPSAASGAATFDGAVPVQPAFSGQQLEIGINPVELHAICAAVAAAGGTQSLSVAPKKPIIITGGTESGDLIMEGLVLPVFA